MALDHTPVNQPPGARPSLHTLEQRDDFIGAISAPDPRQIGDMLGTLGLATLEALIDQAVPAAIRITEPLALSETRNERETVSYCAACATATGCSSRCWASVTTVPSSPR